jgi:hypothetical protein
MARAPRMKITEGSPSTPRLTDNPAAVIINFGLLIYSRRTCKMRIKERKEKKAESWWV